MLSNDDLNNFLRTGLIEGLAPGDSMHKILDKYGHDCWYARNTEDNGLLYGVLKVGITEFHVYNEKITGICYRPDTSYLPEEYEGIEPPWIIRTRELEKIEQKLKALNIDYKKHVVQGPLKNYKTGTILWYGLENMEYTYLVTEGNVTFSFYPGEKRWLSNHVSIAYGR